MFYSPTIVKLIIVTYEDQRFYVKVPSSLIDDPNDLYVSRLLTHLSRDLEY